MPLKMLPSYHPADKTPDLEDCEALIFSFEPNGLTQLVVWMGKPSLLKPLVDVKRLRDLKPGDAVELRGKRHVVQSVGVFR